MFASERSVAQPNEVALVQHMADGDDAAVAAYQKLINAAPGGDRAILAQYYIATTLEAKGATTRAIEAYGKVLTDYPAGKQFDSWKAAADKALSRLRASAAK